MKPNLKNIDRDDVLAMLGLETRRTPVEQWLGFLAIGILAGAGLTLFLARKTGRDLIADFREQRRNARSGMQPTQPSAVS